MFATILLAGDCCPKSSDMNNMNYFFCTGISSQMLTACQSIASRFNYFCVFPKELIPVRMLGKGDYMNVNGRSCISKISDIQFVHSPQLIVMII